MAKAKAKAKAKGFVRTSLPDPDKLTLPTYKSANKFSVSWGVGVDSTAILVLMVQAGIVPDTIIFSDPGDEWEETYDYFPYFAEWLVDQGFPEPVWVDRWTLMKNLLRRETLAQECLRISTVPSKVKKNSPPALHAGLPSKAFGRSRCTLKFKRDVINAYLLTQQWVHDEMAAKRKVIKIIGFEATETHRVMSTFKDDKENEMARALYPLVEWGIDREMAKKVIARAGLKVPRKSACTYCPYNTDDEWRELATTEPEAWLQALKMEALALPYIQKPRDFGLHRRGRTGERQLVQWAQQEGLPVPDDIYELPEREEALERLEQALSALGMPPPKRRPMLKLPEAAAPPRKPAAQPKAKITRERQTVVDPELEPEPTFRRKTGLRPKRR